MNEKSTEFSTIHCSHFPLCSGCTFQDRVDEPPIKQKLTAIFQAIAPELAVPLHRKEIVGWRTRAKLAVRGSSANPQIGLFHRGTHDVVDIPDCPLHHPAINAAVDLLKESMSGLGIEPYDEQQLRGQVRYVQLGVERKTDRVQLVLVINQGSADAQIEHLVKQLYKRGNWHSIWLNYQSKASNTILGDRWTFCSGEEYLWEELGGTPVSFHPACFCQAHLSLFEEMLNQIKKWVFQGKDVVDFFGGVGVIGLSLLEQSHSLVCSEMNPYAKRCFDLSLQKRSPESRAKALFREGSSDSHLDLCDKAEVAIVDPPRKGLSRVFRERLKESLSLKQIIYVSCGMNGFERDSRDLVDAGWRVRDAAGYLLFPGSDHIEIACCFEKKSG